MSSKKAIVLSLVASFCLVLLFQNCSAPSSTDQPNTNQFSSLDANGEGYTGKFTIEGPNSLAPGETATLNVLGGEGPFDLELVDGEGAFQQITDRQYQFTLDAQNQVPRVNIRATDANGLTADKSILVIGVNRWFFDSITDIASLGGGDFALLDQKAGVLHFFDSTGDSSDQINYQEFPQLETAKAMVVQNNHIVFLNNSSLEILDPVGETMDSFELPTGCSDPDDLASEGGNSLVLACEQTLFFFDFQSRRFSALGSRSNQVDYWYLYGDELYGMSSKGQLVHAADLDNPAFQSRMVSGLDSGYMGSLDVTDFIVLDEKLYVLNRFKRHLLIFNLEGALLKKVPLNGIETGTVQSLSQIIALTGSRVALVDPLRKSVQILNLEGEVVRSIGASNYFASTFNKPRGVETADNGDIYVLDSENRRMQVFSSSGDHLRTANSRIINSGPWWSAEGMDLSGSTVAVANTYRQLVHVFDANTFQLKRTIGENDGIRFNQPKSVKVYNDDTVYVADAKNQRILIHSGRNNYRFFGKKGEGPQDFKLPVDIEIYDGHLYILDQSARRVSVFTLNGDFQRVLDFSMVGGLNGPNDMDIDSQGRMVVAENKRVVLKNLVSGETRTLYDQTALGFELSEVHGLDLRDDGSLIIADTNHHRLILIPNIGLREQ